MTDDTQPEALDLADWLEAVGGGPSAKRCAALLREQHARIAELEAQVEALSAAPVGWKLVPVEPTQEMLEAPSNAWPADAKATWAAMLAASPTPPAEQQAQSGAAYAELPHSVGEHKYGGGLFTEVQMRDFADRTHALRTQAAPKNDGFYEAINEMDGLYKTTPKAAPGEPPGIQALMCVISSLHSLRDTAHFSDEEGELTNDLCTLRDWAYAQTAAFQPAPTAQAADSVQEDAARYRAFRDCSVDDRNRLEHYSGPALDVAVDTFNAARKQGENHDR